MSKFSLVMLMFVSVINIHGIYSNTIDWGRIFHGSNTPRGRYPFVVSLQQKDFKASFCGGTLLTSKLIITAAHCIVNSYWKEMIVVAGIVNAENWDPGYQVADIAEVIRSGPFPMEDNTNDVAMAVARSDFVETDFIKFLAYRRINVTINDQVEIMGWGIVNENNKTVAMLQSALAQVNHYRTCNAEDTVYEEFVCVRGNTRPYTIPRYGDSGSPGLFEGNIFGVVSMGVPSGDNGALYARLSRHHDWIEAVLKRYEDTPLKLRTSECYRTSAPISIVLAILCAFSILE